jgi:calcineurin-like phosphoesterase
VVGVTLTLVIVINAVNVPNGFAVTAYAYRYFLEKAGIEDVIKGTHTHTHAHTYTRTHTHLSFSERRCNFICRPQRRWDRADRRTREWRS